LKRGLNAGLETIADDALVVPVPGMEVPQAAPVRSVGVDIDVGARVVAKREGEV
jgi:hypothetical protein